MVTRSHQSMLTGHVISFSLKRMTIKALQEFVEATEKEEELAGAFERMVREEESRLVGMVERFDQEL